MPSILSDDDRETVKRFVPKQTNKIHAVAVARLYIAYPNRSKWTYTGLQGAVVLANDLVGNTYWIKMVDISPGNRGVIWDQEIFENWSYNQDRVFFHTFELEECLAGLSFVDEKEAKQFLKKMNDREKNASKATQKTKFGGTAPASHQKHHHGFLGGLFGAHRHSSAPTPHESPHVSAPTRDHRSGSVNGSHELADSSGFEKLDAFDPQWREHFGEDLKSKGLTDDFIRENQDFIVDFLKQEQVAQANQPASTPPRLPPPPVNGSGTGLRAPPPPPPAAAHRPASETISAPSPPKRGPAPPPPPAPRRSANHVSTQPEPTASRDSPPPPARPRFAVPPPLADAGKFARSDPPRAVPSPPAPGPPPPPRPPKTPVENAEPAQRFSVPPPFTGQRNVPPPPPSRGAVPPPPPSREAVQAHSPAAPPPLPPKAPAASAPPLPPSSSRPAHSLPARSPVPPPPALPSLPSSHAPPAPPSAPPLPASSAPPAPPPPPPLPSSNAPPPPPPPPLPPMSDGAPPPP
ncbi:hypothetical protein C8A03DRAFT_35770, partial [Achaetomium macrosporum]